jgi:hypothetical protein
MNCEPDSVMNTIYYNLTTKQLRALASQNKIENWNTKDLGTLKRELLKIAETKDILGGVEG